MQKFYTVSYSMRLKFYWMRRKFYRMRRKLYPMLLVAPHFISIPPLLLFFSLFYNKY
ncbi:hypothetical protein STK_13295 [Sulfurisphaera tokodaii str. 7]|uniref:Uncharacterized protein n=1 Tax=Sulfurisphaera tokodaii (strain DSM 16993 / JCM 10545 / NBRC 100140 / 7) TaxID=273063 RepID=Q971N2_SULTO|nr:hypothetical protein STK_13295 [Sulfurisphaera tokodaii str. 7]